MVTSGVVFIYICVVLLYKQLKVRQKKLKAQLEQKLKLLNGADKNKTSQHDMLDEEDEQMLVVKKIMDQIDDIAETVKFTSLSKPKQRRINFLTYHPVVSLLYFSVSPSSDRIYKVFLFFGNLHVMAATGGLFVV